MAASEMNKDIQRKLEAAMTRVGKCVARSEQMTGTPLSEQFFEDIKLILFETWVLLQKKTPSRHGR